MKNLKQHILEKLKISKEYKQEIEFSWYEFVKLIYKHDYVVSLLDIKENGKPLFDSFEDLPRFTPDTSKPQYMYSIPGFITALKVEGYAIENDFLELCYKETEKSISGTSRIESFKELKQFLDIELIIQIYDYLKQNA